MFAFNTLSDIMDSPLHEQAVSQYMSTAPKMGYNNPAILYSFPDEQFIS